MKHSRTWFQSLIYVLLEILHVSKVLCEAQLVFLQIPGVAVLRRGPTRAEHTGNISTPAARLGRHGQVLQFDGSSPTPVSITSGKLPTTTAEFHREWKRNRTTNHSRYQLLCQLEPSTLLQIFQVEMDSTVLSGIITACEECWRADDSTLDGVSDPSMCGDENQEYQPFIDRIMIVERLHALVQSAGFPMASKLLSSRFKQSVCTLINRIMEASRASGLPQNQDTENSVQKIRDIAKRFGVQVSLSN